MDVHRTTCLAAGLALALLSACAGGGSDTAPAALTVGGSVVGLSGTLVLADDLGAELTLGDDGPFTFPGVRARGARYAVVVKVGPGTQRCAVADGEGTVGGEPVRDVSVTCSSSKFFAGNVAGAYRLWRTDGTAEGTERVTVPGAGEPALAFEADLQPYRGVLLFAANDGTHGYELWRSDGTAAGTAMVEDANPGNGNGVTTPLGGVLWKGRRYYVGTDGTHGFEPWSSDGTAAGTAMLLDVAAGAGSSRPDGFAVANDAVYFAASHPLTGRELWRTRGTPETTELVQDLVYGGNSSPSSLTPVQGALYFVASTDQLWIADAAGVRMVKDFDALGSPDAPANLVAFAGKLYFTAKDPALGVELWSSDGTAEGTQVVEDVNPAGSSTPTGLAVANGALWFAADDGAHGREPWASDGTLDGTDLVADVSTTAGASSDPTGFTAAGGVVFFAADDGIHGVELWKATTGGAELVRDIAVAPDGYTPRYLSALGDTLHFSAWDLARGAELWRSDGTASGTSLVEEIDPGAGWGYSE